MRGRQRKESERWCPRAAIRTAMPPATAMAILLSALRARIFKTMKARSRTAAMSGCVLMTASVACRGKGGIEVSTILMSLVVLGSEQ